MDSLYVQKVLNGDYSAFSYFVDNYRNMAYSIAFRILENKEDAEDIVQDSFIKAYRSLEKFRQDSKFSTWFYRIVVNNALTKVKDRKQSETNEFANIENSELEEIETIDLSLLQKDRKKYINFALSKLNIEDRLLLTLYYLNENSFEEIAEITNLKKENLKMKIHRARLKIYVILERKLKTEINDLV